MVDDHPDETIITNVEDHRQHEQSSLREEVGSDGIQNHQVQNA